MLDGGRSAVALWCWGSSLTLHRSSCLAHACHLCDVKYLSSTHEIVRIIILEILHVLGCPAGPGHSWEFARVVCLLFIWNLTTLQKHQPDLSAANSI